MNRLQLSKNLAGFMTFTIAFLCAGQLLLAQAAESAQSVQPIETDAQNDQSPEPKDELLMNQASKRLEFLQMVKDELRMAQQDYADINSNVRETGGKLQNAQLQAMTLSSQVANLDEQIANSSSLIENVLAQITEKENALKAMDEELQIKKLEIENQKSMLMDYLKVLYSQENSIADTASQNDNLNIAKILLSDRPIAETLQELKYFKILEANGHEIFARLEELARAQIVEEFQTGNMRKKLTQLYSQLDLEKQTLEEQRAAKNVLLTETRGEEKIYQQLLEQSKQEQDQTLTDIQSLHDNLTFIQQKIAELGDKFNPADYRGILNKETTSVYEFIKSTKNQGDITLRWPVSPSRGISAYFHDEAYRHAMGVPHEAIDIRVLQGTPIHAPADGVVYKTRDNGFGYSYMILAHAGGFMTLYGHVSEIRVQEGEKIKEGQVIGLSGATPGTKGAGLMTTGPHLHFEVLKGGKHVDPLDYLPISLLPIDSLPEKYLGRITGDLAKVRRVPEESSTAHDDTELLHMAEAAGKLEQDQMALPGPIFGPVPVSGLPAAP